MQKSTRGSLCIAELLQQATNVNSLTCGSSLNSLIKFPNEFLPAFDKAIKDIALSIVDPLKQKIDDVDFHVGLKGSFGDHHVNPRTLKASFLGKLVCLEGIVTRCELMRTVVHRKEGPLSS